MINIDIIAVFKKYPYLCRYEYLSFNRMNAYGKIINSVLSFIRLKAESSGRFLHLKRAIVFLYFSANEAFEKIQNTLKKSVNYLVMCEISLTHTHTHTLSLSLFSRGVTNYLLNIK